MVTEARALVIGNYKGRYSTVQAFRGAGFRVSETVECVGGLKQIIEHAPSIVILSQGKTLDQTRRMVRAARCLTSAPIVVVGNDNGQCRQEALQAGADAYLSRGMERGAFLAYIHAVLSKN